MNLYVYTFQHIQQYLIQMRNSKLRSEPTVEDVKEVIKLTQQNNIYCARKYLQKNFNPEHQITIGTIISRAILHKQYEQQIKKLQDQLQLEKSCIKSLEKNYSKKWKEDKFFLYQKQNTFTKALEMTEAMKRDDLQSSICLAKKIKYNNVQKIIQQCWEYRWVKGELQKNIFKGVLKYQKNPAESYKSFRFEQTSKQIKNLVKANFQVGKLLNIHLNKALLCILMNDQSQLQVSGHNMTRQNKQLLMTIKATIICCRKYLNNQQITEQVEKIEDNLKIIHREGQNILDRLKCIELCTEASFSNISHLSNGLSRSKSASHQDAQKFSLRKLSNHISNYISTSMILSQLKVIEGQKLEKVQDFIAFASNLMNILQGSLQSKQVFQKIISQAKESLQQLATEFKDYPFAKDPNASLNDILAFVQPKISNLIQEHNEISRMSILDQKSEVKGQQCSFLNLSSNIDMSNQASNEGQESQKNEMEIMKERLAQSETQLKAENNFLNDEIRKLKQQLEQQIQLRQKYYNNTNILRQKIKLISDDIHSSRIIDQCIQQQQNVQSELTDIQQRVKTLKKEKAELKMKLNQREEEIKTHPQTIRRLIIAYNQKKDEEVSQWKQKYFKNREQIQDLNQQLNMLNDMVQEYQENAILYASKRQIAFDDSVFVTINKQREDLKEKVVKLKQELQEKEKKPQVEQFGVGSMRIDESTNFNRLSSQKILMQDFLHEMREQQSRIIPSILVDSVIINEDEADSKVKDLEMQLQNMRLLVKVKQERQQSLNEVLAKKQRDIQQLKQNISLIEEEKQKEKEKTVELQLKITHSEPDKINSMHLFPLGSIFEDSDYLERLFLIEKLTSYLGPIKKTKLLYRLDPYNKVNFHRYVDKHRHIILIIKTIYGKLIAGYSAEAFDPNGIKRGFGLIISLWARKTFEVKDKRAIVYDDYYLIFGNSELRLKSLQVKLFSNFGIANSYYDPKGEKVNSIIGEGNEREIEVAHYQLYELQLQNEI